MKRFKKLLDEMKSTIVIEELFIKFLYAVIIYLVTLFIIILADANMAYALIPSLGYFIIYIIIEIKKDKVTEVEASYPNLDEELRTARDNIDVKNPVVEELKKDVVQKVKYVRASTFFPVQRAVIAMIIIVFLIFASTIAISNSIYTEEFLKEKFPGYSSLFGSTQLNGSSNVSVKLNVTDDIYGDIETMELGNKELNIKLMPSSYEVNVREEGDFSGKDFDLTYATEVTAESGKSYEENIPKDEQEIVKNYFIKLTES